MTNKYSEQELIENTTIELFKSLGYQHLDCYEEWQKGQSFLGRTSPLDVVIQNHLFDSLSKINSQVSRQTIISAIDILVQNKLVLNPVVANRQIYQYLKNGIKVPVKKDDGSEDEETIKLIDFKRPLENDFFIASQYWIYGEQYKRRADLVGFINGIPLLFIELKAIHKKLESAYNGNLTDYKDTIPQIFWYNAIIILSNGSQSRVGTITSDWEHFHEWKRINSEGEKGIVSLDTIIKGMCQKERLLDILENFILFQGVGGSFIKILAQNHQYLGVNNAITSFKQTENKEGRLGVFWHTQGSGKSFSMIFFSQKILRKFPGNYTFVIVTDRKELDEQIYKNFADVGAVTDIEVHATSGKHLKQLLKENHRNIFTLLQKFGEDDGSYPVSTRKDIIVIADEAHRSQYEILAMNMRKALPNASFVAFTATPLIVDEEKTKDTFGDYVSIYSFKQSVDDQATVPLYYENRIPEVEIVNPELVDNLAEIIDNANFDIEQEEKLIREFTREYHVITRDDRLEKIAEDIVAHFITRGYQGKAMVVAIDKQTAVKMYDKVKKYWIQYIDKLKTDLKANKDAETIQRITATIKYMEETDMAVVVSQEQNEVDKFRKLGLDIATHRQRMNKEDLATKFKESSDPFRIVFVCAMWMTGFDVQNLSTIYLDKPMKNHTLMQTIARANRVFSGKPNGLIVDYIGLFRNLQKALAIYAPGGTDVGYPIKPKSELLKELQELMVQMDEMCQGLKIDLDKIIQETDKLQNIKLLDDAVDAIVINDKTKNEFISLTNNIKQIYRAILPDPRANVFNEKYKTLLVIVQKIYSLNPDIDIEKAKAEMEDLLDESLVAIDYKVSKPTGSSKIDLSAIDFEAIKKRLGSQRKHIEAEKLKNALNQKLKEMVKLNKLRNKFLERFQELVDEYNSGANNADVFISNLKDFVKDLNEEDKRGVTENLSEEELAVFDLLQKPDLNKEDKIKVKSAVKDLLAKLKNEKLVLDWRKKQQTRADVQLTIHTLLDENLPKCYSPELYEDKCDLIYQHIYDSYYGQEKSIYA